jgi:SAM-dependent methyltransferase
MSDDLAPSSFDELFDTQYLRFHQTWHEAQTDAECGLIVASLDEAARPGASLLDCGCGDGRLSHRLAGLGFGVVGVDCSSDMLAAARQADSGSGARFVEADLATFEPREPFDIALSWFTSFGYGPDDESDRCLLQRIAHCVKPGGTLLLETVNRDQHVEALGAESSHEVLRVDDDVLVDERRFDPHSGRLHVERLITAGAGRAHRRFSMRLFTGPELIDWLRAAGFGDITLLGDEAEPFTLADGRMIARARRHP